MQLNAEQKDAVTELLNIAFSRAAASLSELTDHRVDLNVPEVSIHSITELPAALSRFVAGEVATIHQIFGGPVAGDAFLLLNFEGATELVNLLTGADSPMGRLGASGREVLAEVGNILLNACLGVFGNVLEVRFSFAVPRLHLDELGPFLNSFIIDKAELSHALLVVAQFRVREGQVTGCLVLVLGVASLERFIHAVERWAERATGG